MVWPVERMIFAPRRWLRLLGPALCVMVLVGCETPLAARGEAALRLSVELGTPQMPLESGVYRYIPDGAPATDNSVTQAFEATVLGTQRPLFADHFVLQRHAATQSYVSAYGNMRFYDGDGDRQDGGSTILELYADDDESIFWPARIEDDGRGLVVYEYYCDDFTTAVREELQLDDRCRVFDVAALRGALNLLDLSTLRALRFEWQSALPDRD